MSLSNELEAATLGGGCFWCTEAIFRKVGGVRTVEAGYAGGTAPNPTYEQVCTGRTGHAEVVQLTFDPEVVTYERLLEIFWATHDPTSYNRQGADVGTQYRSVILCHDGSQRETAERLKRELEDSGVWDDPIVTEIVPLQTFYRAEEYHRDYYRRNPGQPYCRFVISPKLEKFRAGFARNLSDFK